jgi:hypothetical protein
LVPNPAPAAETQPLPFASQVETRDRIVKLAALADLSAVPVGLRGEVEGLPVLMIPQGRAQVVVDASRLQSRVAALAPALKPWLTGQDHPVFIRYARPEAPAGPPAACVSVREPLPAGGTPTSRSFTPVPCTAAAADAFWFDARRGVVRTRQALRPGDVLRAPPKSDLAGVAAGDPLVVEARVGPVKVQRRVFALQSARPGERLFAKTADGAVISVPYPSTDQ